MRIQRPSEGWGSATAPSPITPPWERSGSSSSGDRASGEVFYDVLAFSRPNLPLARFGYYFMRKVQRHFGKVSSAAMIKMVAERVG